MADTRKHDLEELAKAKENATTQEARDHYDRISHKVKSEGEEVSQLRENLVNSVRNSDANAVAYFQEEIRKRGR